MLSGMVATSISMSWRELRDRTVKLVDRICDWNDEKGLGFVVPNDGGTRAFVHIRSFQAGSRRPVSGDLISYETTRERRGRRTLGISGLRGKES